MNHPRSQQRWAARGSLKTGHLTLPMVLALVLAPVATSVAGRFTGGDKKRSDCYAEFEVENVATASKVECMEGTACDADGQCNGQCTVNVALCLNQTDPNVPKCTPEPPLLSVTSDPSLEVPDLASTTCGRFTGVVVPLKTKKHGAHCRREREADAGQRHAQDQVHAKSELRPAADASVHRGERQPGGRPERARSRRRQQRHRPRHRLDRHLAQLPRRCQLDAERVSSKLRPGRDPALRPASVGGPGHAQR